MIRCGDKYIYPITKEAEAAWGQAGLHSKTMSQKRIYKNMILLGYTLEVRI
jgi:hypothetical protein